MCLFHYIKGDGIMDPKFNNEKSTWKKSFDHNVKRLWDNLPIFHADLDETLRKSIVVIHPLLAVARQPKRKVFLQVTV
jgi:hypothetical protein